MIPNREDGQLLVYREPCQNDMAVSVSELKETDGAHGCGYVLTKPLTFSMSCDQNECNECNKWPCTY